MNIYQQQILDHYHEPSNHGSLKNATHTAKGKNTTCGDEISIELIIKKGTIIDIAFNGEGCAISQAAASMLTEEIKGKPVETLKSMTKDDILQLLEIELSMNRLKCALLALETAQKASNS